MEEEGRGREGEREKERGRVVFSADYYISTPRFGLVRVCFFFLAILPTHV